MFSSFFSKLFGRKKPTVSAQQLQRLQQIGMHETKTKPSTLPPSYLDVNSLFK